MKRKMSPIRFDGDSSGGGVARGRKETRAIYHPPRDQYSQKVTNGSFDEAPVGGGQRRGGWGTRRGRGRTGRRGGGGGSWRVN